MLIEGGRPFLSFGSGFPTSSSPHRTSTFQRIRRSNSGYFRIFAYLLPYVSGSLLLPVWAFVMPGISRSPPPVSDFLGLPGRTLPRRVLWTRSPCKTHW